MEQLTGTTPKRGLVRTVLAPPVGMAGIAAVRISGDRIADASFDFRELTSAPRGVGDAAVACAWANSIGIAFECTTQSGTFTAAVARRSASLFAAEV